MSIPFLKVQGAGNDFVLIDALGKNAHRAELDWPALAPRICDRHIGVGADGILIARDSDLAPARMEIVNADGSDGDMCGNGLRCFVKYLIERSGVRPVGDSISIETGAGVLEAYVFDWENGLVDIVTVDMGPAILDPERIPLRHEGPGPVLEHLIEFPLGVVDFTCVSMGNPHAVWFMDGEFQDVDDFALDAYGPLIETNPDFPSKTNVEIVNVLSPSHLKMRVWERGVGLTQACGTGACAVMVAARLRGLVGESATVSMPGGDVEVLWQGREDPSESVFMTGEARFSFEGILDHNLLSLPDERMDN
ncbi:MAG: diaminopimelate epimerase [Chloroflexi bacterium]|nr:diaminopimelate epimerase [Chloroflexota bacterium]MYI03787.1 diaminopimelate epimerase [Chloroflexota bacterium]